MVALHRAHRYRFTIPFPSSPTRFPCWKILSKFQQFIEKVKWWTFHKSGECWNMFTNRWNIVSYTLHTFKGFLNNVKNILWHLVHWICAQFGHLLLLNLGNGLPSLTSTQMAGKRSMPWFCMALINEDIILNTIDHKRSVFLMNTLMVTWEQFWRKPWESPLPLHRCSAASSCTAT